MIGIPQEETISMRRERVLRRALPAVGMMVLLAAAPVAAADETDTGWSDVAEFSLVMTSGNSETETLGFKNTLTRSWENAAFVLNAGAIRAENTTVVAAIGTPSSFRLVEETTRTAESYYLNGRYNRDVTSRFFWYAGAGWERNRFAGIENRRIVEGGVGNLWIDQEDLKFSTGYGLTFTDQEDVVIIEGVDETFLGFRFSWDYLNKFGQNTTYTNTLVVDGNADETSDFRANNINALAVAMSERMALKVSLQLLYDNQPSFAEYALLDGSPLASTGKTGRQQLDELDTILTVSLVVNF
jgi:putative salt-induced outer membrane protein YdiY